MTAAAGCRPSKGPPLPGTSAGLHSRSEYERRLAHPSFDAAHLATTPWHRVLTKALRKKVLVPQFTTDFVRHAIPVTLANGTRAELALDDGVIRAGRRTARIAEIEIEMISGDALPLFRLAQSLAADLPVTIGSANKAERGFALARGAGDFGEPVHASTAALGKDPVAESALRSIVQGCLAQIAGNAAGLLADTDPEWVHQMRIGTRRLRSCLGLVPQTPTRDALIAEVKWLAQALGNARDWDVFATETLPPVVAAVGTDAAAAASFARLRRRVSLRRVRARANVRDAVRSVRFTQLLLACGALCATPRFGRGDDEALRAFATPARVFAEQLIERRHHKLAGRIADLGHASPGERHKARIAAKKLRYAAEFFAPLFPHKRACAYLEALSALQDVLGHANDAETVHHLVEGLPGRGRRRDGRGDPRLGRGECGDASEGNRAGRGTLRAVAPVLGRAVSTLRSASGHLPYRAPRWLPGGHAQTILPRFLGPPPIIYRRERVLTPDGDFWDFDWSSGATQDDKAPLVVLFHGLESGSNSHYARALMAALAEAGWRGVIPHFRGCSGEPNLLPRAYHSGDHEEVGAMLAAIRVRVGRDIPLYAAGVSLGGSALLNWLGRAGTGARASLSAAAAVSAPIDLTAAGIAIGRGLNLIYTWYFLATLKPKGHALARRFPGLLDEARLARIRTMYDFDEAVTAPLHGFTGATDYWKRASSKPWLADIAVPTLVLNAINDPFIPGDSLPRRDAVSRSVLLELPEHGGHAGFAEAPFPGRLTWMPRRLLRFFRTGE